MCGFIAIISPLFLFRIGCFPSKRQADSSRARRGNNWIKRSKRIGMGHEGFILDKSSAANQPMVGFDMINSSF